MAWYLAPALQVLRAEIDTRWPRRDRTSDGSIGDAAHQASKSDHNPNERESVNAIDVDKDGIDVAAVIAAVERHPSTHYWIYNRQIADRDDGFRRRPYSGINPHTKHLHVSIRQTRTAEQDRRPWGLLEDDMTKEEHDALMAVKAMLTDPDGRETIGMLYKRLAVGKDDRPDAVPVDHPTLTSLADQLRKLADQPPVVVDYDQLADAIVRRAIGTTQE